MNAFDNFVTSCVVWFGLVRFGFGQCLHVKLMNFKVDLAEVAHMLQGRPWLKSPIGPSPKPTYSATPLLLRAPHTGINKIYMKENNIFDYSF